MSSANSVGKHFVLLNSFGYVKQVNSLNFLLCKYYCRMMLVVPYLSLILNCT